MGDVSPQFVTREVQMLEIFQLIECIAHLSVQIVIIEVERMHYFELRKRTRDTSDQTVSPEMDCNGEKSRISSVSPSKITQISRNDTHFARGRECSQSLEVLCPSSYYCSSLNM